MHVSEHYQIMQHCGIQVQYQVIIQQIIHTVQHRQQQHVNLNVIQIIHGIQQQVSVIQFHMHVSEHCQIMLYCGIQVRHQVIIQQIIHIVRQQQQQHVNLNVIQIIHGIQQQVSVCKMHVNEHCQIMRH